MRVLVNISMTEYVDNQRIINEINETVVHRLYGKTIALTRLKFGHPKNKKKKCYSIKWMLIWKYKRNSVTEPN